LVTERTALMVGNHQSEWQRWALGSRRIGADPCRWTVSSRCTYQASGDHGL